MSTPCHRHLLARAHGYLIEHCSCGLVHVTAGPVTMRMEPGACQDFATVLARAAMALVDLERRAEQPRLEVVAGGRAIDG